MQKVCQGFARTCPRSVFRMSKYCQPTSAVVVRSFSEKSVYTHGKFRSDAEAKIAKVPPIEVDGYMAVCDGGGGMLGHPIEYIQLDNVTFDGPATCKYCGLRYIKKQKSHHH